jgi:hypothetical protein
VCAVWGLVVCVLSNCELAYLTSKVAGVGSFADKAVNQGRVPLTPLKTYP